MEILRFTIPKDATGTEEFILAPFRKIGSHMIAAIDHRGDSSQIVVESHTKEMRQAIESLARNLRLKKTA